MVQKSEKTPLINTDSSEKGERENFTQNDIYILLKLNEWYQSEKLHNAWLYSQFEFKSKDWKEFCSKYPKGSDGYESFFSVGHFLELVGVLVKHGLFSEELFFDTFWFEPIWKNFEPVIKSMRAELGEPALEENFEYLYNRYLKWKSSRSSAKQATKVD
jgi:hypothetical protein